MKSPLFFLIPLLASVSLAAGAADEAYPAALRIGLAALKHPDDIPAGVGKIKQVIADAGRQQVDIVCFSETYLPGLRGGEALPPPNQPVLESALREVQAACRENRVAAIVGMEWVTHRGLENRAFVIDASGEVLGHQTKDQITPGGEERNYVPEGTRRMFKVKGVPFGIVICHEGWRFPETVRWATVRGAKIIFQPQVTGGDKERPPGSSNGSLVKFSAVAGAAAERPERAEAWGKSYYEMAMILRAKENSVYFASVNQAMRSQNSATSLIDPDGKLLKWIPYGEEGLLVADLDLRKATGFYAARYRPEFYPQD
ncbi:MAG: carbon-nitrogen hydrolase family protein [Verrucomicrobia bacterium]|nr:carbon-nitrogen hydrolase family protein [Verrucomicrobiota bacterium]